MSGPVPHGQRSDLLSDPIAQMQNSNTSPEISDGSPTAPARAAEPRGASPVIRPSAHVPTSDYDRLVRSYVPAWAISSVVHALIVILLIFAIGSTRPTDARPTGEVIDTTASTAGLTELENSLELKTVGSADSESRSAGDLSRNDPTEVAAVQGLNDLPSSASGRADDSFSALLKDGGALAGLGSTNGSDSPLSHMGAGGDGVGSASFFGTPAKGKRFAIIADNSQSMQGAPLVYLKNEIINTLNRSRGNTQFYVTFFSNEALPQPLKGWTVSREDITAVNTWVKGVNVAGGTVPITGFDHVLRLNPPPDVVYFMTDGQFDAGEVEQIRLLNQALKPPAVIHTVAFGSRSGENELKLIAKQSKGTYRYVASPGKR